MTQAKRPVTNSGGSDELVYGLRASLATYDKRPASVLGVATAGPMPPEVRTMVQRAKAQGAEVRQMSEADLAKLVGSKNHEGVCLRTAPRVFLPARDLASNIKAGKGVALALDRVRNPYNIGALLRSAAFLGLDGTILGAPAPHPALPEDAVRVAEGGADAQWLCRTTDLAETLKRLRAEGVHVIGADMAGARQCFGFKFPRPMVLVLGNEREGLAPRVAAACETMVQVPGSGAVESLNVSVAGSILAACALHSRA